MSDLPMETSELQLWTIQPLEFWRQAETKGVLRADGRRIAHTDFRPAYRWLMQKMSERLVNYEGNYPIWAWAEPKPDLRNRYHLERGTDGVRIHFRAPKSEVLLSDYDSWHMLLGSNPSLVPLSETEYDEFYADYNQARAAGEDMTTRNSHIVASWERILDLPTLRASTEWASEQPYTQATVGQVAMSQVVRVDYFTAR